ncbi:MAG: gamma-glutamyltransferase family protein, partial [Vulcanimicrobiaceae bacterium]
APPNSSGHVLLQELNLIEHFDLAAWGWGSADAVHTLVEAKRLAFADRERFVADPDFCEVPLTELLSKAYAAQRVTEIRSDRAAPRVGAGEPRRFAEAAGQTTCFAVVDRAGNAVCQLQSLQSFWGSGFVADGTGILLNNRMTYFRLDPSHPNVLAPGKRVRHTMNPVMAMRDGELELVFGTPGADSQVQTNLQIMTGIVDFGMNVAEAVEAPRWRHLGRDTESTTPYGLCDALIMESRFAPELLAALAARGQPVERIGPWDAAGSAVAIRIDRAQRVLHGACDPRADGYALGC